MSYTIVSDKCEGVADCMVVCPVECITWAAYTKERKYAHIDDSLCIDCGACLSVCPIEGAILDHWQPELQNPEAGRAGPDELEFAATIGAWGWFLRWENKHLVYGSQASGEQGISDIFPIQREWVEFWRVANKIKVGAWDGDYAAGQPAPVADNLRWRLKIMVGEKQVNCAGGHLKTTVPPDFAELLEAFTYLFDQAFGCSKAQFFQVKQVFAHLKRALVLQ